MSRGDDQRLSGEIVVDSSSRLWFCTASGTPGTWEEITGDRALIAAAQAAADAATADAADAQAAADAATGDAGALATEVDGIAADISALQSQVDAPRPVRHPAGATAAIIHLTLAGSLSPAGFLSVYSGAVADLDPPRFSSLNWATTGHFDANTTVAKVSPTGKIKVFARNPAHVVVDVIGFTPEQ